MHREYSQEEIEKLNSLVESFQKTNQALVFEIDRYLYADYVLSLLRDINNYEYRFIFSSVVSKKFYLLLNPDVYFYLRIDTEEQDRFASGNFTIGYYLIFSDKKEYYHIESKAKFEISNCDKSLFSDALFYFSQYDDPNLGFDENLYIKKCKQYLFNEVNNIIKYESINDLFKIVEQYKNDN